MVAKAYPEEKVGVFARRGAHVEVVEYSEVDPEEAASKDPGAQPIPQLTLLKLLACTSCRLLGQVVAECSAAGTA